ncbi:aminotransferase class I/II-fold pyridoxal phosphate-dependent enzyme [Halomarina halobia]|uniref:Aminotransferase n=1 Tax=Halomarina halobia TaxID=3033386 RepID=A0ABD6AAA7_9EURY|nr:aminotransferase class I/II-fold pyridoxal phosphate-dependent enzyme [Halomarina sp. PSR21]
MDADSVDAVDRVPHGSDDSVDLDLSANCNPFAPDGARAAYDRAFDASRTYPRDDYPAFRRAAADYVGCDPGRVVPTPGGLAAIRLAVGVTVAPGDSALVPYPSFGEYAREVRLQGGVPEFVPHADLLDADPDGRALAVICAPNNPTGDLPDPDRLDAFLDRCRAAGTPLLADEAFLDFTDRPSLAGADGVIVARSLTKVFGLPGLRAGFAVADGRLGERLRTAVPAWALGTPAARVGARCMREEAFVRETRRRVARERERLREGLARHFEVSPSDAPFLLCDVGSDPAPLLAALRERGIALRDATTFRGLDSHVRVAVRTEGATDRLLDALAEVDGVLD